VEVDKREERKTDEPQPKRPVDHQFVDEDRKRMDASTAAVLGLIGEIRALRQGLVDFTAQFEFALREWRERR
jgi:hypothetical protein